MMGYSTTQLSFAILPSGDFLGCQVHIAKKCLKKPILLCSLSSHCQLHISLVSSLATLLSTQHLLNFINSTWPAKCLHCCQLSKLTSFYGLPKMLFKLPKHLKFYWLPKCLKFIVHSLASQTFFWGGSLFSLVWGRQGGKGLQLTTYPPTYCIDLITCLHNATYLPI